jgi:hypothetical protein
MKGPLTGVLKHLASSITSITFNKGHLLYSDDTRVSVHPMKAMIESDFPFFWVSRSAHIPENGARKTISPTQ